MKISLVIPVFNEADQLTDCLYAIGRQTRPPDEVIVVDNNSTDHSALIAGSFSFVKVLSEPRQGVVFARNKGFNAASGDIIARIDADSRLPSDWFANLEEIMQDQNIEALSGKALYHSISLAAVFNWIDLLFRRRLSRQLKDHVYLWGANMAIRRQAWLKVRSQLCLKGNLHEDFDVGLHLQNLGYQVIFSEQLVASISARRFAMGFKSFMGYVLMIPRTYAQHDLKSRRYFWPVVIVSALGYLPGRLLHKGYDQDQGHFSLVRLLLSRLTARVDPTSNVIAD